MVPKGTELVQMRSTGVSRARNGNTVTATVAGGRPADASAIERAEG